MGRYQVVRLLARVSSDIETHSLLALGETVVVGVSGGPDSLCLLHLLCRLRARYQLGLHVAHLHHGMRGAEADADAEYVRALAADWNLPYTVRQIDVPALARDHRLAPEEAARRARYAFLCGVAAEVGARTIAVGHNADDQTETVLMHWLRGSGLAGLRGMLPLTSLGDYRLLEPLDLQLPSATLQPEPPDLRLIRPLLQVTRAEIQDYCDYYRLEPRFDRSNLDTTYFRNWMRHKVLPLLAEHNPNVREVIRRSATVIADDYALLRSLLEDAWARVVVEESLPFKPSIAPRSTGAEGAGERIVFDLVKWRALPVGLQRSTLREAIHRLRRSLRDINFVHVENALLVARDGTTGDQATLPQNLRLVVGYDQVTIASAGVPQPLPDWPLLPTLGGPWSVCIPGLTSLPESDWVLEAKLLPRGELPSAWRTNPNPWRTFLDANVVGNSLWLQNRQPGDRFQPLGMGGHEVKLADFLTNQKVPRSVRDRLPLLVGPCGIAWICGHRVDERARVTDETGQVLVLTFHRG
jgi:tRNA(Ile)-lysidine synthase